MCVSFTSLRPHLKHEIFKKMSFKDYTLLIQSSRKAISNAHLRTLRFPHELNEHSDIYVNKEGEVSVFVRKHSNNQSEEPDWSISLKTLIDVPIYVIGFIMHIPESSDSTRQYKQATLQIGAGKVNVFAITCYLSDDTPCEPEVFNQFVDNPYMYELLLFDAAIIEDKDDSVIFKDLPYFLFWSSETHFASYLNDITWNVDGARGYMIEPRLMSTRRDYLLKCFAVFIKDVANEYNNDSDDESDDE